LLKGLKIMQLNW